MSKIKKTLLIFVIIFTPTMSWAAAISLLGVADMAYPAASNKTLNSQTAYGGGVLLGFPLVTRLSFETGALYYTRNWSDTTSGSNALSSQVLQVPALLRFHLRFLSLGVGGYYSANQGNLSESGTVNNSSLQYGTYGMNPYDYGLIGDLGLHLPLARGIFLRFDARYLDGLVNVATNTSNTFQNRDFQLLAGLTFLFGDFGERGAR